MGSNKEKATLWAGGSASSLVRAWSEKIPILSDPDSQAVSTPLTRVVLVEGFSVHPVNRMHCGFDWFPCGLSCILQAAIKRNMRTAVTVLMKLFILMDYRQLPTFYIPITGFHGTGIKKARINMQVFNTDIRRHVIALGLLGKLAIWMFCLLFGQHWLRKYKTNCIKTRLLSGILVSLRIIYHSK